MKWTWKSWDYALLRRRLRRSSVDRSEVMSSGPYILGPGDGRVLDMGPFRMTVKAASSQAHVALTLLEADEPPGFGPPIHVHDDAGEAFYVLTVGELSQCQAA